MEFQMLMKFFLSLSKTCDTSQDGGQVIRVVTGTYRENTAKFAESSNHATDGMDCENLKSGEFQGEFSVGESLKFRDRLFGLVVFGNFHDV